MQTEPDICRLLSMRCASETKNFQVRSLEEKLLLLCKYSQFSPANTRIAIVSESSVWSIRRKLSSYFPDVKLLPKTKFLNCFPDFAQYPELSSVPRTLLSTQKFHQFPELYSVPRTLLSTQNFAQYPELYSVPRTLLSTQNFAQYTELCSVNRTLLSTQNFTQYPELYSVPRTLLSTQNFAQYPELCSVPRTLLSTQNFSPFLTLSRLDIIVFCCLSYHITPFRPNVWQIFLTNCMYSHRQWHVFSSSFSAVVQLYFNLLSS